jgi:predicted RNA binding protein YcfA (HicA-like mRNA interferase family)
VSPRLPIIKAKELIRVAIKLGFEFDRQSGSHAIYYRKSDKRRIVIPIYLGKDIKPKTLAGIIKDMGLEADGFRKLL